MTRTPKTADDPLICLGVIIGAHGVKGAVRLKSFTARPQDLCAYGVLCDAAGMPRFELRDIVADKNTLRAHLKGIGDRNAAEALKETRLYVRRSQLPAIADDDFYHSDLIGLMARTPEGEVLGVIDAVHNFGAGDMLEVAGAFIPFTRHYVPHIDVAAGFLIIMQDEIEQDDHKAR